ncbi:MAG TPA: fumarylacetoacetate hydrolase family protein [Terracidiphilus sp.]
MSTATDVAGHRIPAIENDRMRQAAEILLRARRERMPIADLPVKLQPHTLDEAYALQDIMAEAFGPMGGWKVGAPSPEATPLFSAMPFWGGYGSSGVHVVDKYRRLHGVEAEIAFLLGSDLPPRKEPYSQDEVRAAIASAHPAIELLESAFFDPDKAGRLSAIGDLQSNGGFVHGAARPDWQHADLARESVTVSVDGAVRFTGTASNSAGTDLLRLVTFLANEGCYRTAGLRAGDWITTGSWSGKTLASRGSQVEVEFSTFGVVTLSF